jgi:hypothetical protein
MIISTKSLIIYDNIYNIFIIFLWKLDYFNYFIFKKPGQIAYHKYKNPVKIAYSSYKKSGKISYPS